LLRDRAVTAAGLLSLNQEWGERFYHVPDSAVEDDAAAAETFRGQGVVIDVQTHFMAPHAVGAHARGGLLKIYRQLMPDWWREMDDIVAWSLSEYVRNVFLETENAVAILSSGPGVDGVDQSRHVFNDEMAATRALFDGLAGTGRLLNHTVVHPDIPAEVEAMAEWRERFSPAAWKVYTPGRASPKGEWMSGWMLDDEEHGLPFLERARSLGVNRICAHKGISGLVDNGSPRDIGPVAKAFPDMQFIVYHSGYEMPLGDVPPEGPYLEETAHEGVNRLIHSVRLAGLGPGSNVYAELGSTWFCLVRRPVEAAHVLGKLIAALGEDNVIWGTDSIWYGSAQPLIDAFRAFQIPDEMCARYGYRKLTAGVKEKILSLNAARVYNIDLERAGRFAQNDDLAWAAKLIADYEADGFPGLG
jgi:predicted TIM-barrel fold metal-dependent hydrolase